MRASLFLCVLLAGCSGATWQDKVAADAVKKIGEELHDPALAFFAVQVVGNQQTGQTCGRVFGEHVTNQLGKPARFIVYIDNTSGPYIEGQRGHDIISDERFDFAWQYDCLNEGWKESRS